MSWEALRTVRVYFGVEALALNLVEYSQDRLQVTEERGPWAGQ